MSYWSDYFFQNVTTLWINARMQGSGQFEYMDSKQKVDDFTSDYGPDQPEIGLGCIVIDAELE